MCGILAILGADVAPSELRERAITHAEKLRHRGPDWGGALCATDDGGRHHCLVHQRLAIVFPESGAQPLRDSELALTANGEIYNHKALAAELETEDDGPPVRCTTSDCEVLLSLFRRLRRGYGDPAALLQRLRGMWAFVALDRRTGAFLVARDHMGICPLYMGWGHGGTLVFASEMKALTPLCARLRAFPPGHYCYEDGGGDVTTGTMPILQRWYRPAWAQPSFACGDVPFDRVALREALTEAVRRRLMADAPWGVLLSGGLDSSLVASIACRLRRKGAKPMRSFTIGLNGSPDLVAARHVANFLGTEHHAYTFCEQEGLDALSFVVRHLETYDVTTVRASVPMYLMSRRIKSLGIKMVLSGEGADEAFGGYLYFHRAPSVEAFHRETVRKLMALHQYDCLRANKAMAAWGVEARVPFLDADFLDHVMHLRTEDKLTNTHTDSNGNNGPRMEKWPLRHAFDTSDDPYLPEDVLWRRKEQFSDGVGHRWIDVLRAHAETAVTDTQLHHARDRFPHNPPTTKEAYLYRDLFARHFPQDSAAATVPGGRSIACSTEEALAWDASFADMADPSGRDLARTLDTVNNDDARSTSYKRIEKMKKKGETVSTSSV